MHQDRHTLAFALLAVLALGAVALAQSPMAPPILIPAGPLPTKPLTESEVTPAVNFEEPGFGVKPVQRLEPPVKPVETIPDSPTGPKIPTGITSTAPRAAAVVSDPPTPAVQLQIRTPAHIAGGKPIAYKLIVTNNSGATAYRVRVRVPLPEGVGKGPTKCEPAFENDATAPNQLVWTYKQLAKGESKTIEIEFKPSEGVKEVRLRGHVAFEHGSEVVTAIDKPKLQVKKTASPQVAMGELITVRVEVVNSGTVPIPQTRLVETADGEFKNDKDSEKGANANQRIWQLGTLEPGQAKFVTYQLLPKKGGELVTTSTAASDDKHAALQSELVESKTKVLVPALTLDLKGPATVNSKEAALYTARVQNTGTQPLTDVRVSMSVPDDCEVKRVTAGSRRTKDTVMWQLPKLAAGEAFDLRLSLESATSGKKVVKATVRDSRGVVEDAKQTTSDFLGRADLTWKPEFDDVQVNVGKQGLFTVTVRNQGTETEKAMALKVELPANVKFVQGTPNQFDQAGTTVLFKPRAILPGKTETFTVTYEAKQAGPAYIRLMLDGESLGKQPLTKEQLVQINNSK